MINILSPPLIQAACYQSAFKQSIKGLFLYVPTVIWVSQGKKRLWWRDKETIYSHLNWLIIPARQEIAFINEPQNKLFSSRALSFYSPPPQEWIASSSAKSHSSKPQISLTPSLGYCFDMLFEMKEKNLSYQTQKQLLWGFYAELESVGALHLLFSHQGQNLSEHLAQYLSFDPGKTHKVSDAAKHFLMSRSTFIRKLSLEKTSFRQVLIHVRMLHSLSLMQGSQNLLLIALSCGYQSTVRFSNRFKRTFGLTPRQYLKTL